MPVMDGITMCKKIKEEVLTSHIPVVLLSAFNEVEDQLHGLGVGADDYIGKPFDKHILRQKIENIILSRKRLYQSFKDSETPDIKGFDKSDKRLIDRVNQIVITSYSIHYTKLYELQSQDARQLKERLYHLLYRLNLMGDH